MSYAPIRDGGLDYHPCHYGTAKPVFRGPERKIVPNAVVALGGTETFGKFIEKPWPERLESRLGRPVINLGSVNAGLDLYLGAPHILNASSNATAVILQILGAATQTNRYYAVHPLRNDRFIEASPGLCAMYRNVDFSEFHFIRHLLNELRRHDPRAFGRIVCDLQQLWVQRMRQILTRIEVPVVGVWLADKAPPEEIAPDCLGSDPLFVTAPMLEDLRDGFEVLVEITPGPQARQVSAQGRVFNQMDRMAAAQVYPAQVHQQIAEVLAAPVSALTVSALSS